MIKILRILFLTIFSVLTISIFSQEKPLERFISDTALLHSSVSVYIADTENGEIIAEYGSGKSLIPASVMKLITSAAAVELLGPGYTFKTTIGYTGSLNKKTGRLKGDIVIKGGGDPALGSKHFEDHYKDFTDIWVSEIIKSGITKIDGRVITDDSYFDYQPIPDRWLWEDIGNYFGAGVYGLSVFDNTYEIHLETISDSTRGIITGIVPPECTPELSNFLKASGKSEKGIVFSTPYSSAGWLAGTIPSNEDDYILDASISDPPQLIAEIMTAKLEDAGFLIYEEPSTVRAEGGKTLNRFVPITETVSPPLSQIITVLNRESINLYAEHLIKELGKKYKNSGTTASGIEVIIEFLKNTGINTGGMFIEDGSGLSPRNSITSSELTGMLIYMQKNGNHYDEYFASLPEAGKNGTLKYYFKDPVFDSRLNAKSGSMTRVRAFAGYFTTLSERNMAFCIIVNNFSATQKDIVAIFEHLIKGIILNE
jgi:D-alanyl-D-alanine carboxypeptidase/D-alanyl-D-alanine-endopeptidase (penicillin-binding protein 4)